MHPNPIFRRSPRLRNIAFAIERSFGTLAINQTVSADGTTAAPLLSHIPFQLSPDGKSLEAHLVRSNPIVGKLREAGKAGMPAVLAVTGADAYISPDWYGVDNQVPTWNYVAVHLRGVMRLEAADFLPGVLDRLSGGMESRIADKKPWTTAKMDQEIYERMRRQILPVSMRVTDIDGTWKLSQNKTQSARLGAAEGVLANAIGSEADTMAGQMRAVEPDKD